MLARSIGGTARLCLVGTQFLQSPCKSKKWSWDSQASRMLSQASNQATWEDRLILQNPQNNIPPHIASLVGRDLHLINSHPLAIIKQKIVKASLLSGFSRVFSSPHARTLGYKYLLEHRTKHLDFPRMHIAQPMTTSQNLGCVMHAVVACPREITGCPGRRGERSCAHGGEVT
jgi:hypothetical protein